MVFFFIKKTLITAVSVETLSFCGSKPQFDPEVVLKLFNIWEILSPRKDSCYIKHTCTLGVDRK